jgi:glycosyltransferase involved in cell wall biosynthesis
MNGPRVLYLAPAARRSGRLTEFTFLDDEIRAFAAAGVEAHLLSTFRDLDEVVDGVHIRRLPERGTWRDRVRLLGFLGRRRRLLDPVMIRRLRDTGYYARYEMHAAEYIRENDIDLVHSMFGWPGGYGGALACDATSVPLIANFRGMDLIIDHEIAYGMRTDPVADAAIRMLVRRADRTLYATSFMRNHGISLGADPARAVWIPKGVDTVRFRSAEDRPQLRQQLGFRGQVILCVCGLIARKRVDTAIEALAELIATPQLTLVICGDGPERSTLEQLARKRGVADRVRFEGYVERANIPAYFAACDIFVLTSQVEAAGNVVLEAMSAGRPVICTDSGGPPEYVRHGETGYVVPGSDPAALAARLNELLDDPVRAQAFGARGREIAVAQYSYERMVSDVLRLYEDTLAGARHRT